MADYTLTGLLANIRRRAMLPAATANGTADADLTALANDELILSVAADLLSVREEYFVTYTDTALTSSTEYRIPSRAIGQTLRLVQLRDAGGNERNLTRLRPEQVEQYAGSTQEPFAFYLRGSTVVLVPSTSTTLTTLRMVYALRPSEMSVSGTEYGAIAAINTGTGTVTFSAGPSFATGTVYVDFVSANPGFDVLGASLLVTSATATTATVAAASLPSTVAVGDYVCLAGKAPVPTIPLEFHPILAIRTAIVVCIALGDHAGADRLGKELEDAEKDAGLTITSPRTQGSPQKAIARHTALRAARGNW